MFILSTGRAQEKYYTWQKLDIIETSELTIVLLEATWCSICKSAKREISTSTLLHETFGKKISTYAINEHYEESIKWNDSTYYFVPNGLNSGTHQFIEQFTQGQSILYPIFLIFNRDYKLSALITGFKSESEWESILGSILNH